MTGDAVQHRMDRGFVALVSPTNRISVEQFGSADVGRTTASACARDSGDEHALIDPLALLHRDKLVEYRDRIVAE